MVAAAEPDRVISNGLLATRKPVHGRFTVLATLPQPAAIGVLLHGLPLESRARSDFDIATSPDVAVWLVGVPIGVERHRTGEVPVAEFGDGSNDEDVVAVFGADLDREGE